MRAGKSHLINGLLWALYEASPQHLAPFEDEAEVMHRVEHLREDKGFLEQLRNAAQSAEPDFPPSPHLEEQIYGHPFPPREDEDLMDEFRAASWERRAVLARQFNDVRYRRIGLRLIYFERPDLLAIENQTAFDDAMRRRLTAAPDAHAPWRSIPAAKRDLKALLESDLQNVDVATLVRYRDYLEERADSLRLSKSA